MAARSSKIPTLLLTVFCIALTAVIWFELRHPPKPRIASHEASRPLIDDAESSNPDNTLFFPPLSQYGEIVERPLFLAERRPPKEEEPEIEEEVPENEYILLGVILLPERKAALLRVQEPAPVGNQNRPRGRRVVRSGESKVVRLQIGEDINGWRLETVADDKVILRKGEQTKDVLLVRNRDEPVPRREAADARRAAAQRAPVNRRAMPRAVAAKRQMRPPSEAPATPRRPASSVPPAPAASPSPEVRPTNINQQPPPLN